MTDEGYPAHLCEVCHCEPTWTLVRQGDVVVSWACKAHVSAVLLRLQRDHEVTQIVVTHTPKALEWADIARGLRAVARDEETP